MEWTSATEDIIIVERKEGGGAKERERSPIEIKASAATLI